MMIKQRRKARKFALQGLYQMIMADHLPRDAEEHLLEEAKADQVDLAFLHQLLFEIHAKTPELDQAYEPYLGRPIDELTPIEQCILRLATYELSYEFETPYKVIINEALELAKRYGAQDSYKFINGVLDKLARQVRTLETGNLHG